MPLIFQVQLKIIFSFIVLGAKVELSVPLINAKVGTNAFAICTVTADEEYKGWFMPDGSKITTSLSANIRVESNGKEHKIRFDNVQVSYGSNNYQCRGSKNTVKLQFHVAGKYK